MVRRFGSRSGNAGSIILLLFKTPAPYSRSTKASTRSPNSLAHHLPLGTAYDPFARYRHVSHPAPPPHLTYLDTSLSSLVRLGRMSRRFLMLTTRIYEAVAQSERKALLKYTGLRKDELINMRLEREAFPHIDLDKWDGIIMCGSHFDVSARPEDKSPLQLSIEKNMSALLEEAMERDFPILGVCYGLGLTTTMLGGVVGSQISEQINAPELTLTQEGRHDPILKGIPDIFHAYVGHHESVLETPPQMVRLVTGLIAPMQMARVGKNIYLTQFHPELDYEGISVRIEVFADFGYYPKAERTLVEERVKGVDVSPAHLILSNFVNRFGSQE